MRQNTVFRNGRVTHQASSTTDRFDHCGKPLAVVTGGAKRVGRAICIALAQRGFDLVLSYRHSLEDAELTSGLCSSHGAHVDARPLDLQDLSSAEHFCDSLLNDFSEIHLLIHCAGVYEPSPWGSITYDSLLSHAHVNLFVPILITQRLTPALKAAGGSVLFFGDIHARQRPRRRYLSYALSKAAVEAAVGLLAREMAPEVRVNGIAPGVIAWPEDTNADERASYEKRIPLARSGTPEDAAALAAFLACDAPYITGEIVSLDGGRRLM